MIPSRQEIAYRTYGAWLLARFDAGGARYFDESPLGTLRSFFAAALVAPAYFIGKLLSISGAGQQSDAYTFFVALVFALAYSLPWPAPVHTLYRICQVIDR